MVRAALTIAGSDSSGGAGIQADIKTMSALGIYSCTVITAITAQNTLNVNHIHPLDAGTVKKQIRSVLSDIPIHALKIGMVYNNEIITAIKPTAIDTLVPASILLKRSRPNRSVPKMNVRLTIRSLAILLRIFSTVSTTGS